MYTCRVPTWDPEVHVQKVLLSMILALFMALALVGVKRVFTPADQSRGPVLTAEGNVPTPPIDNF